MTERQEIELVLENTYLSRIVSFITVRGQEVQGKVNNIAYETSLGEPTVIIQIDRERYEVDLPYFNENIELL